MLHPSSECGSLPSEVLKREIKKLGEVAFPAQVRSDTYYFYAAAYFYFGSVPIVAFAMPAKKITSKNNDLSNFV